MRQDFLQPVWTWLCIGVLAASASACTRDPVPCVSPVGSADLAITEIRGKQPADPHGAQWVEVCNPTARAWPLAGLVLAFLRLDGSSERTVLVRDRTLAVAPGACAVLGLFGGVAQPGPDVDLDAPEAPDRLSESGLPYAAYDFSDQWDLSSGLYDAAVLELRACGVLVDRVVYRDLPDRGTWSLDGSLPPSADANDAAERWCVDSSGADLGYPGTPGVRNRPCE